MLGQAARCRADEGEVRTVLPTILIASWLSNRIAAVRAVDASRVPLRRSLLSARSSAFISAFRLLRSYWFYENNKISAKLQRGTVFTAGDLLLMVLTNQCASVGAVGSFAMRSSYSSICRRGLMRAFREWTLSLADACSSTRQWKTGIKALQSPEAPAKVPCLYYTLQNNRTHQVRRQNLLSNDIFPTRYTTNKVQQQYCCRMFLQERT